MTTEQAVALVPRSGGQVPSQSEYRTMLEMAGNLLESGFLPRAVNTPQKALAIIQKGRELGIPPMYALSNIAVIDGKPTAGAELMLALIYRDHGDNAIRIVETDADHCTIIYQRRSWREAQSFTFSKADAQNAGLLGKDNWKKYPAAMLRARCISAVARLAFPDSIGGMYTPEEMGAEVEIDEAGETRVVNVSTGELIEPEPSQTASQPGHGRASLLATVMELCAEIAERRHPAELPTEVLRAGVTANGIEAKTTTDLTVPQLSMLLTWATEERDSLTASEFEEEDNSY